MAELVKANVLANLAYYRRSRLLIAFLLVFLLISGLSSLPALFTDSGVQSFNSLREVFSQLNEFLIFFAGGLGLFVVGSHLRSRSLKMVFTKPCSPTIWLASAFVSAAAVSFLLCFIVLVSAITFSFVWHVSVRAGLVFISIDTFVASLGVIAYLMLLASVMHPAIAATCALIFNANLFYGAQVRTEGAIRAAGDSSLALRALVKIFHYLYLLLPMVHAFGKKTEGIYTSYRVLHGEWKYLLYSLGYSLALSAFCCFVAVFALQKKKHI